MSDDFGLKHKPKEIRVKRADKVIEIDFDDGKSFRLPAEFLRVDGNPVHRAAPDRLGGAGWSGPEAAKIIDELKAGTGMVVRSFAAGSGAARDEFLSLGGFGDALTAYRDNLRTFGILRRK